MHFSKWQGCGNDFVLVDCLDGQSMDFPAFARHACDRHYGIGADGVLLVLPSEHADIRMRIFNTDGSEAEMCGNGIRCFARYLYDFGRVRKQRFTVETGAGILEPELIIVDGDVSAVCVDMGEPVLSGDSIPVSGFGERRVIAEPIEVGGEAFSMTCVSIGNPHCVVFVDDIGRVPLERLGPMFESHTIFPRKTNTEFAEVRDPSHIRMRVWERGAAITLACGTGSCATLVAGVLEGRTGRTAKIELDGGTLKVEWREGNNHVYMTGPAELVFEGECSMDGSGRKEP